MTPNAQTAIVQLRSAAAILGVRYAERITMQPELDSIWGQINRASDIIVSELVVAPVPLCDSHPLIAELIGGVTDLFNAVQAAHDTRQRA